MTKSIKKQLATGATFKRTINGKVEVIIDGTTLYKGMDNPFADIRFIGTTSQRILQRYRNFWAYQWELSYKDETSFVIKLRKIKKLIECLDKHLEAKQEPLKGFTKRKKQYVRSQKDAKIWHYDIISKN